MDAFMGEIRAFALSYAPRGWMLCNGQSLSIQQYPALFAVISNKYGGDRQTHFSLPNIQGNVLVGSGTLPDGDDYPLGIRGGGEDITLTSDQMPAHTHTFNGLVTTDSSGPAKSVNMPTATCYLSNVFEGSPSGMKKPGNFFSYSSAETPLNIESVGRFPGEGRAHNNMQPFLVLLYCICIDGIFPPRS